MTSSQLGVAEGAGQTLPGGAQVVVNAGGRTGAKTLIAERRRRRATRA